MPKPGMLAIMLGKKGDEEEGEESGGMGDIFAGAFSDFKSALKSDDAEAGKEALKTMIRSCKENEEDDEEEDY